MKSVSTTKFWSVWSQTVRLRERMAALGQAVLPAACLVCEHPASDKQLPAGSALCRYCKQIHDLALFSPQSACLRCALPLTQPTVNTAACLEDLALFCPDCLQRPPPFQRCRASTYYETVPRALVSKLKVEKKLIAADFIASVMSESVTAESAISVDSVLPVPLHRRRYRSRGFNQSQEIAKRLAKQLSLDLLADQAERIVDTPTQQRLSRKERELNLKGAFVAHKRRLAGRRVAVIDDVVTSTATVSALATTLRDAGVSYCEVWCYSRTPSP